MKSRFLALPSPSGSKLERFLASSLDCSRHVTSYLPTWSWGHLLHVSRRLHQFILVHCRTTPRVHLAAMAFLTSEDTRAQTQILELLTKVGRQVHEIELGEYVEQWSYVVRQWVARMIHLNKQHFQRLHGHGLGFEGWKLDSHTLFALCSCHKLKHLKVPDSASDVEGGSRVVDEILANNPEITSLDLPARCSPHWSSWLSLMPSLRTLRLTNPDSDERFWEHLAGLAGRELQQFYLTLENDVYSFHARTVCNRFVHHMMPTFAHNLARLTLDLQGLSLKVADAKATWSLPHLVALTIRCADAPESVLPVLSQLAVPKLTSFDCEMVAESMQSLVVNWVISVNTLTHVTLKSSTLFRGSPLCLDTFTIPGHVQIWPRLSHLIVRNMPVSGRTLSSFLKQLAPRPSLVHLEFTECLPPPPPPPLATDDHGPQCDFPDRVLHTVLQGSPRLERYLVQFYKSQSRNEHKMVEVEENKNDADNVQEGSRSRNEHENDPDVVQERRLVGHSRLEVLEIVQPMTMLDITRWMFHSLHTLKLEVVLPSEFLCAATLVLWNCPRLKTLVVKFHEALDHNDCSRTGMFADLPANESVENLTCGPGMNSRQITQFVSKFPSVRNLTICGQHKPEDTETVGLLSTLSLDKLECLHLVRMNVKEEWTWNRFLHALGRECNVIKS